MKDASRLLDVDESIDIYSGFGRSPRSVELVSTYKPLPALWYRLDYNSIYVLHGAKYPLLPWQSLSELACIHSRDRCRSPQTEVHNRCSIRGCLVSVLVMTFYLIVCSGVGNYSSRLQQW